MFHAIFIGTFATIAVIIATTLGVTLLRMRRDLRTGREPAIRWAVDYHELPERSRSCRHELTREVDHRECPNGFDCRICDRHHEFGPASPAAAPQFNVLGLTIPLDRRYHRGHTWVHGEPDGTFTVGLDPLAIRLVGPDAEPELPPPGTFLTVNGTAWTMRCGNDRVRVLSPINGTVVEARNDHWYLKVQPAMDSRTTHLLSGSEVEAWMSREVERLQCVLSSAGTGVALADGGTLVNDPFLAKARSEMLLEA